MNKAKLDYLILGGGLSGLYCARRLLREKGVRSLMIVEAKNRLGGRVQTYRQLGNGNYADFGAQWISPAHTRVQELCKKYNIKLFPTYSEGDSIYQLKGQLYKDSEEEQQSEFAKKFFECNDQFIHHFLAFLKQKNYLDNTIPKITLLDYLDQFLLNNPQIKANTDLALLRQHLLANLESVSAYPISNISLNQAVFMEESGQDFTSLEGEFDQLRVENGTESIISKLSLEIDQEQHLSLNSKVLEIVQHSHDNVEVKLEVPLYKNQNLNNIDFPKKEISYFTKNLIVSIPPFILKDIKVKLSNEQNKLNDQAGQSNKRLENVIQNYQVGNVIKTFVVYDTPFWRKEKLNGSAFSAENQFISDMYDMSCTGSSNGVIQLFSVGTKATAAQNLTKQEFKTQVIDTLVQFFGKQAYNYFDYYSHSFINDPFVRGGYAGIPPLDNFWGDQPGTQQFQQFNLLKNQNIFFIGTETSISFNGYLEGALCSVDHLFDNVLQK